jgi:hypothetical protein
MNDFTTPLSKAVCDRIERGLYEPDIASIFVVTLGGSVTWWDWGTINGKGSWRMTKEEEKERERFLGCQIQVVQLDPKKVIEICGKVFQEMRDAKKAEENKHVSS